MPREPIVAAGLLTEANLKTLGDSLKQVFKIDETPCFTELLRAIDERTRAHGRRGIAGR